MPASRRFDHLQLLPLLESHPDILWMSSEDGQQLLYCSAAFETVFGCTRDTLHERPALWSELVHADDRGMVAAAMQALLRDGRARITYRIVRPDGELRWIDEQRVVGHATQAGSGGFVSGIARDITGAMQSEQLASLQQSVLRRVALGENRDDVLADLCRQLEGLVPQTVATILLLDDHRLLRVAAAPSCAPELAAALDGLVPGDNIGSCGTAAFTGMPCVVDDTATDPRWASLRATATRFGIRSCWSFPIRARGESVIGTIAISSLVNRSPTAFHLALLATVTQLTGIVIQHDRDRQDLVAAMQAARSAMQARNELLANVSHELRTPLTAMLGFAELVLDNASPSQVDDLRTIRDNGEHLLKVINDLLDISKAEAGGFDIERRPCSMQQILGETVRLFEQPIRGRGLQLRVEGAQELPASVATDATRVRQILVNLVSNAVKFTESGTIVIRCACEHLDDDRVQLEVAVSDSGIGMTPEQLDRIFTPFSQADASTTRRFGGTGLGLSLSRQLARLLDGEISVASEFGRGSTFTLRFVAEVGTPATALAIGTAVHRVDAAGAAVNRPLRCRVLVAEDTPSLRRLTEAVLRKAGADVVVVEHGAAACQTALAAERDVPFDLVLMDMQMPVMDGYEATRSLRQQGYLRPIVALTARALTHDLAEFLQVGCTAYLSKPLRAHELLRTVAELTASPTVCRPR